ncbi:Zn-ribbon domain-containing OB-fold protein [Pseudonocardia sp. GCM10023141]|uniref:Zn-ribbon domain-containing OB-fold protein n=1 Tax=Pseudonocardia sp. GCM10023141 TaxID=3252653 RepID=UPI00360E7D04
MTATTYDKPLPDVNDPGTAPFWAATREGEVRVQRCGECDYLRWPPGPVCPECLSRDAAWIPVQPTGRLVTFCVYHRAFHKGFAADVPYAVGYVELDSGPRLYAAIVGELDALEIGAAVRAVFDPVTPEVTLVRFAVVAEPGAQQGETTGGAR